MGLITKDITRNSPLVDVIDLVKLIRAAINANLGRPVTARSEAAAVSFTVGTDVAMVAIDTAAADGALTIVLPRPVEALLSVWLVPVGDGTAATAVDANGITLGVVTTTVVLAGIDDLTGQWRTW